MRKERIENCRSAHGRVITCLSETGCTRFFRICKILKSCSSCKSCNPVTGFYVQLVSGRRAIHRDLQEAGAAPDCEWLVLRTISIKITKITNSFAIDNQVSRIKHIARDVRDAVTKTIDVN